jgi:DEP domain-containing protein 5
LATASHVEISFKDEYLARSDMWRLTISELIDRTVYKGQKIVFIGTIKAQVTSVYVAGRKVHSAFFSSTTKPIFRSESAQFVLFIQMSREMWDFDSEGSGEIMFTKVVNGFLPALFKRWVALKARHLVSIVLFTRVEYDGGLTAELDTGTLDKTYHTGVQVGGSRKPYKDFYRVVVSEMESGEWTTILYQLKREFRFFRHDISMHRLNTVPQRSNSMPSDTGMGSVPGTRIEAEPTLAMHGNVLEAIKLASTQFSHDYIDRDLVRTGISIVLITPGAGIFEVDYETLRSTTETLISNGIGIDLVCLPKVPLHSVPIFRYRNPHYAAYRDRFRMKGAISEDSTPRQGGTVFGSFSTLHESTSPTKVSSNDATQRPGILTPKNPPDEWIFAVPHWLDVSFWTGAPQDLLSNPGVSIGKTRRGNRRQRHSVIQRPKNFGVRCKMYELEMSSITNDEISVAPLEDELRPRQPLDFRELRLKDLVLVKGSKKHASLSELVLGPGRSMVGKRITQAERDFFEDLDAYDEKISIMSRPEFQGQPKIDRKCLKISPEKNVKKVLADDLDVFGTSFNERGEVTKSISLVGAALSPRSKDTRNGEDRPSSRKDSVNSTASTLLGRSIKLPRQISLGNRGFGIAAPKIAVAELHMENANASKISSSVSKPSGALSSSSSAITSHFSSSRSERTQDRPTSSHSSFLSAKDVNYPSESRQESIGENPPPSRPIAIKSAVQPLEASGQFMARSRLGSLFEEANAGGDMSEVPGLQNLKSSDSLKVSKSKLLAGSVATIPAILPPETALSPWLNVLNPSNPDTSKSMVSLYKRWHHVFPRPLQTKSMKWKSLCSPASVPLTTEYFPTRLQLNTEYHQRPYNISENAEEDLSEVPKSREEFLRELISLRLSHGFQFVVGPVVAEAFGQKVMKIADAFDREHIAEDGASVFMSMGNTIHQLSCLNGTEVEVNMFTRKSSSTDEVVDERALYNPAIRTTLANDYESREIVLSTSKDEYSWNYVDSFLAGHDEEMTETLRFWRARFVLIPVQDTNINHRRQGEDSEEEIRLEGIKALTQLWQRHRYIPPSERMFQSLASRKRKDPNPLNIVYQTQDPSVVVKGELETLALADADEAHVRRGQLLSESEPFRKANLNIAALAEAIQAPVERGGVRMQNRRWHFRLHYNCFIGSDMTTWLLENFEDVETRAEAVELGNMLMVKDDERRSREKDFVKDAGKENRDIGIFVHVEKRHPFRDGQYFYQVVGENAKPRPERGGGWPFGSRRRDNSVPSTPLAETPARDSPKPERLRSGSNNEEKSSNSGTTTPTFSGQGRKVALSKVMKYDVDPRKRSYRPERINLHYDRLHNPDNCYHIRIDWMNVTPKLIEDAIESWASTAEKYGLRLIEVPIGEACSITETHPFRSPYMVNLAIAPPEKQPPTYFDATSLVPQASCSRHYYQKAILKKHHFVLDMEAAQNFPTNVDVTYSWGRPDYRYSQYIHKSGVLLLQITDDGNFLLLANKLYNNRATSSREQERFVKTDHAERPARQGHGQRTPVSSPMLRAYIGSPVLRASSDVLGTSMAGTKLATMQTPESIKDGLEKFCSDSTQLEIFYKDVLEKSTPPSVTPPVFQRTQNQAMLDHNIPMLGLPPGVLARETSPSSMRLGPAPARKHSEHPSDAGSGSGLDSPRGSIATD